MFYTYILYSRSTGKKYVGSTEDLVKRMEYHNHGKVISTKSGRPWELLYYEAYQEKTLARRTEIFYKSSQGRRQIKKKLGI